MDQPGPESLGSSGPSNPRFTVSTAVFWELRRTAKDAKPLAMAKTWLRSSPTMPLSTQAPGAAALPERIHPTLLLDDYCCVSSLTRPPRSFTWIRHPQSFVSRPREDHNCSRSLDSGEDWSTLPLLPRNYTVTTLLPRRVLRKGSVVSIQFPLVVPRQFGASGIGYTTFQKRARDRKRAIQNNTLSNIQPP